ncbi:hypothetical protein NHX12_013587 [Muraenolepis orangiensis]|uniref:snRNA-activating protein complex subunit 2 n=1 Tax=Muraenolepis orangiensis TaxID=630683 RepID=A0A9Q0DAF6_9TELE|nr:hypothetical protein NHX12_013587 [Muraenolepis orangiensis]
MRPPPRQRLVPHRYDEQKQDKTRRKPGRDACSWSRTEHRRLLGALEQQNRSSGGGRVDIDYELLQKRVPTRNLAQLQSTVEELRVRAVSTGVHQLLWQRRAEEEEATPAELWRDMAALVAGPSEDPILTAFSQTLQNSASAALPPGLAKSTVVSRLSPGHVPGKSISKVAPPPPLDKPTATTTAPSSSPLSSSTPVPGTSATPSSPVLQDVAGCRATASAPPGLARASQEPGTEVEPADSAGGEGRSGQGSKCGADYQKIYLYLANSLKDGKACGLTPMESAVVLDLLMALPEELPLLDCSDLRQHMEETSSRLLALAGPPDAGTAPRAAVSDDGMDRPPGGSGAGEGAAALGLLNPFAVPFKLLAKRA